MATDVVPSDRVLIAGLVLVAALAGCTSVPTGSDPATTGPAESPEPPTATEPAEPASPSTASSPPRTTLEHTTYLVVVNASESRAMDAPEERRIAFGNLTDARQEEFLTALESGEDVAGPEGWGYGDNAYVKYEGKWDGVSVLVV